MSADQYQESFEDKTRRNFRVKARCDELMREGGHGHYETMFRVVREEIERERKEWQAAMLLAESAAVSGTKERR